jgi:tetratricopeptide (TPR) repeat protein
MLALTGYCDEMTGAPPHAPFVEIIEGFTRTVPAERLREALGDDAAEVAKIAPELHRSFPDIPPPVVLPNEHERRHLFNSLRDFFKRASLLRPLLLVLEDLQWADDAALALLCHLAEKLTDMPILILGTYRDVEVGVEHRLGHVLELLTSRHHCRRIDVRPLADLEVAEMIHAITGQDPPDLIVAPIYAETEGNPFFIEEVVRYLIDDGRLIDAEGRLRPTLTVGDLDVPDRVRLIIGRRLARLNDDTRRLLTAAAVIGRRFGVELLQATAEVAGEKWLDAIEEAERARVILPDDNRTACYRFSHELIRQTLVVDTSLPRRQRLHLRVAEAMQGREARGVRPPADEIAHHLVEAGALADPPRTVHYLVLAASQGLAAGAFERALQHVRTALHLLPAGDQRGRAILLEKRAQAERSLGRWDEALVGWRAAVAAYEELDDGDAVGRLCWELALQLLWSGRFAECHDAVERGLRALGERSSPWRVQLLTLRGKVFSFSGNHGAADVLIGQAIDLAEELDGGLLGVPLLAKCMHHLCWGEVDEARQAGMRGAEVSRSAGDLVALSNGLPMLQAALLALGRLEEAVRIGEELAPLTSRFGHNAASLVAGASRAVLQAMAGDFDTFEQVTLDDFALCRETGMPGGSELHIRQGVVAFWRGHWDEALNSFEEAVRQERTDNAFVGTASAFRLLLRAHQGDRHWVTAVFEERRRDLPRGSQRIGLGAWMNLLILAEALAIVGVEGEAAAFYPVAQRMIESRVVIRTGDAALVEAVAGMCAAAGEDWPRAEEHYRTALCQARDLPHRIAQPEVRRWFAQMLLLRDAPGDRDQAWELLAQAIRAYRALGMPRHLEMAEALLPGG